MTEVLDVVGLTRKEAGRYVGKYSLGMHQRLGIGLALMRSPSVLVLDTMRTMRREAA